MGHSTLSKKKKRRKIEVAVNEPTPYLTDYNSFKKTNFAPLFASFINSLYLNIKINILTEENYFRVHICFNKITLILFVQTILFK